MEDGDTLYDIAQLYWGDGDRWAWLAADNGNVSPDTLQIGQKLYIPPPGWPDQRPGR